MHSNETLDRRLHHLGERLADNSSVAERVMLEIGRIESVPTNTLTQRSVWAAMRRPRNLVAATAVVALIFLGVRPFAGNSKSGPDTWWLAPPAAWSAELSAAIEQASTKGFTSRGQVIHVLKDGTRAISSTTNTLFVTRDRYRRDIFDQGQLRETQWYVTSGDGLTMTSVRFDQKNYSIHHDPKPRPGAVDPVVRMRALAAKLSESGRRIGTQRVDGQEAVEFEIAATKIDIDSDEATMHVWLDQATKMPLRITYEFAAHGDAPNQLTATILIQNQFDWNPRLPAETFTPRIPEGYAKADSE